MRVWHGAMRELRRKFGVNGKVQELAGTELLHRRWHEGLEVVQGKWYGLTVRTRRSCFRSPALPVPAHSDVHAVRLPGRRAGHGPRRLIYKRRRRLTSL